jgi:hypothetical protein
MRPPSATRTAPSTGVARDATAVFARGQGDAAAGVERECAAETVAGVHGFDAYATELQRPGGGDGAAQPQVAAGGQVAGQCHRAVGRQAAQRLAATQAQPAFGGHAQGAAIGQFVGAGGGQFAARHGGVAAVGLVLAAEQQPAAAGLAHAAGARDRLRQREVVGARQFQQAVDPEGAGRQAAAGGAGAAVVQAVAQAQRAGVDVGAAGVGAGAGEREDAAAALLDEPAAAFDDAGEAAVAAAAGGQREAAECHRAAAGQRAQGLVALQGQRAAGVQLHGVAHRGVAALDVAAEQDLATAGRAAGVQPGAGLDLQAIALHAEAATAAAGVAAGVQRAGHAREAAGAAVDDDATLAHAEAARLHHTFEVEHGVGEAGARRGADVGRAAVGAHAAPQRQPRVQALVAHVEEDEAVTLDVEQHLAGGDQADAPRRDLATVQQLRCHQRHRAVDRVDVALAAQFARTLAAGAELQAAAVERVAADRKRAGHQATDVDARTGAEDDAARVDQPHAAVAAQRAVDQRGVVADDAVEQHRAAAGLHDVDRLAGGDREAGPVQAGLRRGLPDEHQARRRLLHGGLAAAEHGPRGQGQDSRAGTQQAHGQAHGPPHLRPRRRPQARPRCCAACGAPAARRGGGGRLGLHRGGASVRRQHGRGGSWRGRGTAGLQLNSIEACRWPRSASIFSPPRVLPPVGWASESRSAYPPGRTQLSPKPTPLKTPLFLPTFGSALMRRR